MPKKLNWKALFKKKFNNRATLLNFIDFNLSGIINKFVPFFLIMQIILIKWKVFYYYVMGQIVIKSTCCDVQ